MKYDRHGFPIEPPKPVVKEELVKEEKAPPKIISKLKKKK